MGYACRAPMADEYEEQTSEDAEQTERERRWSEGVLRDTLRKAVEKGIEAGVGTLRSADSALRGVTQDGKLPKEVIGYVLSLIHISEPTRQLMSSRMPSSA